MTETTPSATYEELEALRQSIHGEIDATPIHEVRARFIASNQTDSMAGILLGYLTRNEPDEDEHRHSEKSALAEALNI
jgi:hypothetical protein